MIALNYAAEKRFFPRIQLNKPIPVHLPDGRILENNVQDISEIGFQLLCDRATALLIHPDQSAINDSHSPRIRLSIHLPYPVNLPPIDIDCRLRYIHVISSDEIAFGVLFEEFHGDGAKHYDRFIQQCLMPVCPVLI